MSWIDQLAHILFTMV